MANSPRNKGEKHGLILGGKEVESAVGAVVLLNRLGDALQLMHARGGIGQGAEGL
jgi:hypothetical protein